MTDQEINRLVKITMDPFATKSENMKVQRFVLSASQEEIRIFDYIADIMMNQWQLKETEKPL